MGAVSVEVKGTFDLGGSKRLYCGEATMSSCYEPGGDTVDDGVPGDLGYEHAQFSGAGYVLKFDRNTQRLRAFGQSSRAGELVEVRAKTDLSAVVADFLAVGP